MNENRRKGLVLVLGVILAIAVITILSLPGDDESSKAPAPTVTTKVDGPDADRKADDTVTAPKRLVDEYRSKIEKHLRGSEAQQRKVPKSAHPLPTAGATQSIPGCRTSFVRNQSSRNGVRPRQFWLHYTVSHNVPGWSDVNAIVSLFNNTSYQASSHFVLDQEGNCAYIVPLESKSWTQAAANPIAVSVEIIDYGNESSLLAPAGYAKLSMILAATHSRTGLPVDRIGGAGCSGSAGVVDHFMGGTCAGGHHDIRPISTPQRVLAAVGSAHEGSRFDVLVKHERRAVSRTCFHRARRDKLPHGARWDAENAHVADWKRTVHANYVAIDRAARRDPRRYRPFNRGIRRKLQADVYAQRRGACKA